METPKTLYAKTPDGLYIAYQDVGTGPDTLVLVNGMYSHIEVYWEWRQFGRFVERLATSLRVLHFDRRGTGMSDRITDDPTLEHSLDDVNAVLAAAGVEKAAIYANGPGAVPLAVLFATTYPERTRAVLLDCELRSKWAPDYPWGRKPEEEEEFVDRMCEIWGLDEHSLEIGQLTVGDRPEDGPWHDEAFVRVHARLARYATTPGGFRAFERTEYETDAREIARTLQVPSAVLVKTGAIQAYREIAEYTASLIPGARLLTVPGAATFPMFDEEEAYADAMIAFLRSVRHEEAELDRVLATVLFTDIVDSTATAAVMGDAKWRTLIDEHDRLSKATIARYRGEYRKSTGDGLMATFDGPARAVRCAQALVEEIGALGVQIRAGAHTGEITFGDNDLAGLGVHVAARVAALAGASEVWTSSTVKDLTAGSGLTFEDAGEHELKGVPDRWHLYRMVS